MDISEIINEEINEFLDNDDPIDPNYIGSNIPNQHLDGMDNYDAGILYEDIEGINQIRRLSKFLLLKSAEKSYQLINKTGHFEYLEDVYLDEVSNNDFGALNDFIKNESVIYLHFDDSGLIDNENPHGNYKYPKLNVVVYEQYTVKDVYKLIKEKGNTITATDLYKILFYYHNIVLVHELQHAYDDYRTDGNIFNSKKYHEYKASRVNGGRGDYRKYINQPHELWAGFTEMFSRLKFTEPNGEIRAARDVINDMSKAFKGYEFLDEKNRKRIQAEVLKHWQQKKEQIEKDKSQN